jgi:predicted CopG family antitoxin
MTILKNMEVMMKFVRLFLNSLVLTTLALSMSLQANISPLAFKEIFEHFKPGYELYAPNIGCAALKNGTVDAIRFYNVIPGPQDSQGRRLYIQDKALKNDPFAALAILLFPSPAGQLTAMTSHSQSIGAQLSVQDVATLLNFCAKVRTTVQSFDIRNGQKFHVMGGNEFGSNFNAAIKRLQAAAQNQVDTDFFKNFLSNNRRFSIILPRAKELLSVLCKCIELEERDDRRTLCASNPEHYKNFEKYCEATFYPKYTPEMLLNAFFCLKFGSEEIQTLIQNLDEQIVDHQAMFEAGLIDQGNLEDAAKKSPDQATLDDLWVIQNRDLIDAVIPYARQCKPVNNGLACGYDRTKNQLLENKIYPDCTETTIRHLCNLALYNKQTKNWNLQYVQDKISNMQTLENFNDFYQIQKPEQANSGEAAVRNAWSKVVNNLDDSIRYNQKYLADSNHNDNEVDSGLVNIIRVLNSVFNLGLEQVPVYQNDNQYAQAVTQWATSGLETFFETLAPEKQNISIEIDNVATYTAADNRKDCSATITVQVGQDFKFVMSISSGHAQFDSITTLVQVNQNQISSCVQHHAHTLQHSGEQILLLNAATKDDAKAPLHKLFSKNVIDSAAIINMLKELCPMLTNTQISYTHAALILRNALERFLWQDGQMSCNIQPILRDLFNLKNNEICAVLSQEVKTIASDLWLNCFNNSFNDVSKFFTALEKINLSYSGITKLEISGDVCPNLKQLDLSNTRSLESVTLSGSLNALERVNLSYSGIKTLEISGLCPNLKQLQLDCSENLESIILSGSFNALENIQFSRSRIKKIEISCVCPSVKKLNMSNTQNLESIILSGSFNALEEIDFSDSAIKTIEISGEVFPNLKKLNLDWAKSLESLTFSGSFNALEEISLSQSAIKKIEISENVCPNLKKLNLDWAKSLESLTFSGSFNALEEIRLSDSAIKKIEISGEVFPNLKKLNLDRAKSLESLTFSGSFNALEEISLSQSAIKKIEISENVCPNLKKLNLNYTHSLESLTFSGSFNALEEISLFDSAIKTIEISGEVFPNLKKLKLDCTHNLESLTFSGAFNALEEISLSQSAIKPIEISGEVFPNLKKLKLSWTKSLESITSPGSFNALEEIDLDYSEIKKIEISGEVFPNLKRLMLSWTKSLESLTLLGSFNALEEINLFDSAIKTIEISGEVFPNLKKLKLNCTRSLESLTFSGSFNALEEISLSQSAINEFILDKNAFPKIKTDNPRIKFVDKKKEHDDDQLENEIGKENKHFKFVEIEDAELIEIEETNLVEVEAYEQNNTNNEMADQQINWCNLI